VCLKDKKLWEDRNLGLGGEYYEGLLEHVAESM